MKNQIFTLTMLLTLAVSGRIFGQNVGIGEPNPGSTLSVKGGMSVGTTYSSTTAPTGGLIIEGRMGVGTNNPDTNAILDMSGAVSKGIKMPRTTAAQRSAITSPSKGLMLFDTDSNNIYFHNGTSWTPMLSLSSVTNLVSNTVSSLTGGLLGGGGSTGSTWYTGSSTPGLLTSGNVGDYYLNTTNGNYYKKTSAIAWTLEGSLMGPTGSAGSAGAAGAAGARGATGVTGATGTNGTNGAVGATGAAGTNGTNGTNGAAGATGAAGAGYYATSATSLTIASSGNTPTITTQSGLAYVVGSRVRILSQTNAANYMEGTVASYSGTSMVITITNSGGSGTIASWYITLAGNVGAAGTNGAAGATGPTGAAGTNGTNGTNGAVGATGAAGTNGTNGATGATGAQGIQGVAGPTGAAGTNGTNGAVGATGAQGITGATGAAGANGTNGTNGAVGATGATGTNGTNGAVGATGAQGIQGVTGAAGTNGTNGAVGTTGAAGAAGTNGSTWITGIVAPTGGQGNINDLYLNTSTDIYYVKTAATTWTQKNDLDGVTGPTGTNGTNGAVGATGPTGVAGTNGTNGAVGTTGAQGVTGPTGAAGTNGAAGATGPTGTAGTNGATWITGIVAPTGGQGNINDLYLNTATDIYYVKTAATTWTQKNDLDGATGPTGANGTNGTNGAAGATGPTGAVGTNGTNGAAGATGAAGTNGAVGATGPTGAAGTNGTNGVAGAAGAAGTNGSTWITGTIAPTGGQGNINDLYLNTATDIYYVKTAATTWTQKNDLDGATGPTGANGTNGTNGAVGATGPTGAAGTNGAAGAAGTNGSTWLTGTVAPTGGQGNIDDLYLNTSTDIYYLKTGATTWTQKNDLDGAVGATGAAGTNGTNGAAGATGPTGSLSAGSAAGNTPYWNGTTWVLNSSNIYNDGANIGIGTTSPSNKFQVNDGSISISNDNSTAGALYFYEPSTGGGNYMAFKAQAMAANITYTLPAADGSSGQLLSTNGSGTLSWSSAGSSGWGLTGNSINAATNFIGTTNNTSFRVRTNNVERFTVDSLGNVGIGTSKPGTGLWVIDNYNGKNVATMQNTNVAGYSSIDFWDNTGNLSTTFGYANSGTGDFFQNTAYMNCYTNNFVLTANSGSYNLFIQGSTGNIGINTNSPQNTFDVSGAVAIGSYGGSASAPANGLIVSGDVGIGTTNDYAALNVQASGGQEVLLGGGNKTGSELKFLFPGQANFSIYDNGINNANSANYLTFANTSTTSADNTTGTALMVLDENGNLGIGTVSPLAALSVGSSSQFRVSSTGNITKINNVTTSFPSTQGAANTYLKNDGSGNLTWATASGTAGATGPTGATGPAGPTGATGAAGSMASGSAAGNTPYWNGSSWVVNSSNIYNDGDNVGIGTSSPNSALEVSGGVAYNMLTESGTTAVTLNNNASIWYFTGSASITLPSASSATYRKYTIVNRTNSSKTISNCTSLSGGSTVTLASNTSIDIISTGTAWVQIR